MKQIQNVSQFCSELKDFERESECNFLASNCVGFSWYLYLGKVFIYLHTHIDGGGGLFVKNHFFYLLDMDRRQSAISDINPRNRRRFPPHRQLRLVLLRQHPRGLHAHKFAFLKQGRVWLLEFSQTVKPPQIYTIGIVFASPCWFCNSASQSNPRSAGCCWLFSCVSGQQWTLQ